MSSASVRSGWIPGANRDVPTSAVIVSVARARSRILTVARRATESMTWAAHVSSSAPAAPEED